MTNNNTNSTSSNGLSSNLKSETINNGFDQYSSFATNVTNLTHDPPKRTRFSFKPEHLAVSFINDILFRIKYSFLF